VGQVLDDDQSGQISGTPVRAAQYVRMSTEHQKYSTENQSEAIQNYAARRGIEISAPTLMKVKADSVWAAETR
jgi:hypothetical protein